MKFQDSSLNGLEVRVGTKKCDSRTHDARSKSNMPHQLFQSWGHNNYQCKLQFHVHHSYFRKDFQMLLAVNTGHV